MAVLLSLLSLHSNIFNYVKGLIVAHSSDKLVNFEVSDSTFGHAGAETETDLIGRRSSNELAKKWFKARLEDCQRRSGSLKYTYQKRGKPSPFFDITFIQDEEIADAEHPQITILLVLDPQCEKVNEGGKNEGIRFGLSRSKLKNLEVSKRFCTMVDFLSDSIVNGESTDSAENTLRYYTDLLQDNPRKRRLRLCGLFVVPERAVRQS